MKFPSFSQWKQIFKVLKKPEKITLSVLAVVAVGSFAFLVGNFYFSNTVVVPALGGTYTEGVVGQPRFINPIYGETNDIDRSISNTLFSGLMTYDNQGQIVPDLAKSYQVSADGKTYDVTLKNNALWSDGKPLTADDVIFTIKTIQSPDYKSPLRANWIDVDVQKISDTSVRFILRQPYNSFLENLTVKIIPQHIWQNIPAENFTTSVYNLQPIGSGPFRFAGLEQTSTGFIKSIHLTSNRRYYNQPSYIANLTFQFFGTKDELVKAANAGQVQGFTLAPFDNSQAEAQKDIHQGILSNKSYSTYAFSLPRYFAVFFNNQKNSVFADPNIRKALTEASDKDTIIKTIAEQSKEHITSVNSPILPDFYGYQQPQAGYGFDVNAANALLDKTGFTRNDASIRQKTTNKKPAFQFTAYLKIGSKGTAVVQLQQCLAKLDDSFKTLLASETNGTYGKGTEDAVTAFQQKYLPGSKPTGETGASTRQELNTLCAAPTSNVQPLKFTLTTIDQPQLVQVANLLKTQWQQVGVEVDVNAVSITDIKTIIKNRSYDALLYGEALGAAPDPYPFWHSSQKIDPGLNLSEYENKQVDQLLQDARQATNPAIKEQKLEQAQGFIVADAPALFLYNPDYLYWVSGTIKGIETTKIVDPAKRFATITSWYVATKRAWK